MTQPNDHKDGAPALTLEDKLARLPKDSGVYQFKDAKSEVIYVGKAKNLRSRVRSYFQEGRPGDAKTRALVRKIADVEIIVTDSEVEALILENTLIKERQPRYNINLKDDKSYPYIRITKEPYPRIFPTRKIIRDGSQYIGPYTDVKSMKYVLRTLRTLFPIRSCDLYITEEAIAKRKFKVCLDYQIKKCEGPCEGLASYERYNTMIKQAVKILKGKTRMVERELQEHMQTLAAEYKFEEAAVMRNRYLAVKEYSAKQKVVTMEAVDRDIMALARKDNNACSVIFKVRDGKLIGKQHFYIGNAEERSDEALLQTTFERFYLESDDVPEEIFLPVVLEHIDTLETWLQSKRGGKVQIVIPKIGEKQKLVRMVEANAQFLLGELELQRLKREQTIARPVLSLERDLRLKKTPRRIECFDNSHIQGAETVSSMVVFVDGKPKKSEYRKYKIRTVDGVDDFLAMREVLRRRYGRMIEEDSERPDLIIVDGGKGQLSSAVEVLRELDLLETIPVIGLAKRLEEVFFPMQSEALLLPKSSSSLRLIQHLRDEAHRFAITFHRSLRDKRTLRTQLTDIPGVGAKTAQKLIIAFGSAEGVAKASPVELRQVAGAKVSKAVSEFFGGNDESEAEDQTGG